MSLLDQSEWEHKPTALMIISSVDENDERTISYVSSADLEIILANRPKQDFLVEETRKEDRTCVICHDKAVGYNFGQITCESCKAFFRRNALRSIEKIGCVSTSLKDTVVRCEIRPKIRKKCRRCRLLKCFQCGMEKEKIRTYEDQHRQFFAKSIQVNFSASLTSDDWTCLTRIQNSYLTASQSSRSSAALELVPEKISAFMHSIDVQNTAAVKLINFFREIPEFQQLDGHDRLVLVKYNLVVVFLIRHSLSYDNIKEICYDHDTPLNCSRNDQMFAYNWKSLFILCCGYEFHRAVAILLDNLAHFINRDALVAQLVMLIILFSKGLSAEDDSEPTLHDDRRVLRAQSKYLDLLFRYLMKNSSYESVAMKMVQLTQQILRIQRISRDFQQYVKTKGDVTYVNPLMKSLLHFA